MRWLLVSVVALSLANSPSAGLSGPSGLSAHPNYSLNLSNLKAVPNVDDDPNFFASPPFPFNILVLLPAMRSKLNCLGLTIRNCKPVFEIAIQDVERMGILPKGWANITFYDSRFWEDPSLAERWTTVGMIEAYSEKRLDSIFGFVDQYGLATVSKLAPGLGKGFPVFTTAGMAFSLGNDKSFPLLTRLSGSYMDLGLAVYHLFASRTVDEPTRPVSMEEMNYKNFFFMMHDKKKAMNAKRSDEGASPQSQTDEILSSECYFGLQAIKAVMEWQNPTYKKFWSSTGVPFLAFDEDLVESRATYTEWLKMQSFRANVIILCASPETVREIMLAAYDLGMATSGDYVFINIDVSTGSHAEQPWLRANDTDRNSAENQKAKDAYKALKTISLRRSDQDEYKQFEKRVVERANQKYHYKEKMHKEYEMNNFISAFYDAVLLYAIALNETLRDGLDPRNGHNITSKMWGRTFAGITGNVSIDKNGDRYSDYSLFDLDPDKEKFVEVAYYSGAANKLESVGTIHWVGGQPPKDLPICGYDKSKCPKGYPLHVYLLCGAGAAIVILALLFAFFLRRYRLEQELAAMSWKIRWEELDGEENTKKEKKKRKRKNPFDFEGEALIRTGSRGSINSDKFDEDAIGLVRMRLVGFTSLPPSLSFSFSRSTSTK